jgi:hypothetical protein
VGRSYFARMPVVDFLTDDEAAAYGRFVGSPSQADLERVFFLDDEDRALVGRRRGEHMKLGFALQLVTVRWLGTFLEEPLDVPGVVLEFVAEQLAVEDPPQVKRYTERRPTPFDHQQEIRRVYRWKDFASVEPEFVAWVAARSWTSGDGPKAIFIDGGGVAAGTEGAAAGRDDPGPAGRERPGRHDEAVVGRAGGAAGNWSAVRP